MVELHKAADQAMKGFIVRLWPGDALPNSFFGHAAQFYQAEDGSSTEKLFWSQYAEAEQPMPMSD